MKTDLAADVYKWVDSAISGKAPVDATRSWWAVARMNRSKYGRLASPMGSRGLGHDSE